MQMPKMKENKVTKTIATKGKKKTNPNQNLEDALRQQAERNVMQQFGINGTNIHGSGQDESSAVGRRDLFAIPDQIANAAGLYNKKKGKPPI